MISILVHRIRSILGALLPMHFELSEWFCFVFFSFGDGPDPAARFTVGSILSKTFDSKPSFFQLKKFSQNSDRLSYADRI